MEEGSIYYTSEPASAELIHELYNALGWNDFLQLNPQDLAKAMEQSWRVLNAYDGHQLVGTGRLISDGVTNAYLCGLGVLPVYRNQGVGMEIVRRLVDDCRKHKLHLQLLCEEDLVPYYERMGFRTFAVGMK